MPRYDYRCSACGVFEVTKGMRDPAPKKCPTCKGTDISREYDFRSVALHNFVDASWHHENGGRGRYISQLGDPNDPGCYARARHEIPDLAKRKGFQRIEKC